MMNRITKSSKAFFISGLGIIVFSIINRFFLINKNFNENFKALKSSFYSSDLFLLIGFLFLCFSLLYLLTNKKYKIGLSERLALIHYFSTTCLIVGLMFIPILDTINGGGPIGEKSPVLLNFIVAGTLMGILLIFTSIISFIMNLFVLIGSFFK